MYTQYSFLKSLLFLLALAAGAIPALSQNQDQELSIAALYLSKSKTQKVAANVFLGTGTILGVLGGSYIVDFQKDPLYLELQFNRSTASRIGLILTICSIPLYASSFINTYKALTIDIDPLPMGLPTDSGSTIHEIPIIRFTIPLSRSK